MWLFCEQMCLRLELPSVSLDTHCGVVEDSSRQDRVAVAVRTE